jgi:hypothetical protein
VPAALQAQAWAALGKVSLISEALCRTTAPLMVTQLGRSTLPAVRNNILLALSDMCMQYTLLVDSHLGKIAACMQDAHPLVRKQALALMASLLQREFVKWRGPLFVQCASPYTCIGNEGGSKKLYTRAPNHIDQSCYVCLGAAEALCTSHGLL